MTETRLIGQRVIWVGMSLCVMCLAYFYMLDRILFSSASFSPIFRSLLMPDVEVAWIAVAICCLAALWNRPAPILRLVDFLSERAAWVAFLGAALCALGAVAIYHDYPLSMDEYAAVFQAKIFAAGHLSAQLPPSYIDWLVVRGFNGEFLVSSRETGETIEAYWPGFALLLAPFEILHAPWLCNACLAGLALHLIDWITHEITQDKRAAGWALVFALASGAFVADGISYYSLQAHLTANLLFAALLLRPNRYRALCAGLVGSLALILHNPLPHALFASPWLMAIVMSRNQRRYLLLVILGYLPGMCIGLGWLLFKSHIGSTVYSLFNVGGLINGIFAWPNLSVLNTRAASFVKMWVWAVPCLFVFAALGLVRHRENSAVRLLASSAALTFLGYLFVTFDQGHGWGYRYFHSAWGVIPILAGCAMTGRSGANLRVASFAGACAILSFVIMVPYQLNEVQQFISHHLAQLPPARQPGNNVYFIRPRGGFYVADLVQIDPYLRDVDLILVSRGADLDAKMVLRNWPGAVKIGSGRAFEQWYLGPKDHRQAAQGSERALPAAARFELLPGAELPIPPSAADR
jgi:hypothetical protein